MRYFKSQRKAGFFRPGFFRRQLCVGATATLLALSPDIARADESGISFWIPGFFGSLAATPSTPGWSMTSIYFHDQVSAGGNVARAREFQIGNIPANLTATVNARVNATLDLGLLVGTYTFATPVLGAQVSVALLAWLQLHLARGIAHRSLGDTGRCDPLLAVRQYR